MMRKTEDGVERKGGGERTRSLSWLCLKASNAWGSADMVAPFAVLLRAAGEWQLVSCLFFSFNFLVPPQHKARRRRDFSDIDLCCTLTYCTVQYSTVQYSSRGLQGKQRQKMQVVESAWQSISRKKKLHDDPPELGEVNSQTFVQGVNA